MADVVTSLDGGNEVEESQHGEVPAAGLGLEGLIASLSPFFYLGKRRTLARMEAMIMGCKFKGKTKLQCMNTRDWSVLSRRMNLIST